MIRNYLKITFRTLWSRRVHSLINVLGLGLGIACCVLIALYVHDEWTFDQFHSKAHRIFRANIKENWGENQQFFNTSTPFPLGPVLKENFSEIEKEVRIVKFNPLVKNGKDQFAEYVTVAGQDFFDVFDFEISNGSRNALHQLSGAVITGAIAQKYFANENPINKTISIQLGEDFEDFIVQAVVNNIPSNSSIYFGIMISDLNLPRIYRQQVLTSGWFDVNPETYVLLRPQTNVNQLLARFPALFKTLLGDDFTKSKYEVGLQPLTDIHLNTDYPVALAPVNNPQYSYILAAIAGLILIVACINFITLSIGQSIQRAKEVGIRKVVGAKQRQLIFQFIGEALAVTVISLFVGLALAKINLSLFNDLADKKLMLQLNGFAFLLILTLVAVIGVAAGSYPAFILSAFKPALVLKGKTRAGAGNQGIRKVLVGVQLILSIFLISSTLVMQRQLNYLQSRDLGFSKEQLIAIPIHVAGKQKRLADRVNAGFEKIEQFKLDLAKFPDVAGVCGSSHDFGNGNWTSIGYTDEVGTYRQFNLNIVDDEYLPTMRIELKSGRNFSQQNPADLKRSILVNEAFAKEYNWNEPLGKRIPGKGFADHEVIGVLKDFNYASLYTKVQPLVIVMDPKIVLSGMENINIDNSPIPKLFVRLRAGNVEKVIRQIKGSWERISPGEEFAFSFVDQTLDAQYRSDQNLGKIVSLATLLSIVIGSFGLYGLASLAMQSRTKEISIRKVMGASERSLLVLLSKDYLFLIIVSLLISIPLTVYLMTRWLLTFEYRVNIGVNPFLLAGGMSLAIAIITIGYKAISTALSQPAETLKYE